MKNYTIHLGSALTTLKTIESESIQTVVTSPPYFGLRDYGVDGQLGAEPSPEEYIAALVAIFDEVYRVMRPDATCWLNLGDSYARNGGTDRQAPQTAVVGSTRNTLEQMPDRKQKCPNGIREKELIGIPWTVAFALRSRGFYLRQDIIWQKPNPMPESVKDRCTKSHEYIFLLTKSAKYFYDSDAIKEPCVLAGSREGDTVLDPFCGAGTTAVVALRHSRKFIGIELNPKYIEIAERRIAKL